MTWPTKTDFVDGDVLTAAQVNNIGTNLNLFDPTSATTGQVWVADGAGSGAYASAGGGMTVITSGSLAGQTAVTLSAIPQTYKHLQLTIFDAYGPTTSQQLRVSMNANNTCNFSGFYVETSVNTFQSVAGSSSSGMSASTTIYMNSSSDRRNQWVYTIPNYTETPSGSQGWHIAICDFAAGSSGGSNLYVGSTVARVAEEAPVTSIVITGISLGAGNTITAGDYILWGIS